VNSTVSAPAQSAAEAALQVGLRWGLLMSQAQGGDAPAYRRLLIELAPYLRAIARRYHRDPRDVEDSVQDVLLTLHVVRHTYDPARPFKPWLVTLARRRIADRLRTQWRTCAREAQLNESQYETFAEERTNPSEEPPEERLLQSAIEQLPAAQRQAVRLLKMQEMSLQEAAQISGQSVSSLKVATHRAMKSLRRLLAADRSEP
jgi:RNA polymerase sigma-70 factor (ECF subfamily)